MGHPALSVRAVPGVRIYYPVFGAFPFFFGRSIYDYLRDTVSIRKGVEGLRNTYNGEPLPQHQVRQRPCRFMSRA